MTIELYTEDRLYYQYYPVNSNSIHFKIKAPHDAHVILTQTPYNSQPCYEIFFGGWKNTKSVIRKNQQQPDVVEVATPNILNPNEYKGFWIRWEYGLLSAGIEGNFNPILRHNDPQLFPIQHFGVCTGWGATGHWLIESNPLNVFGAPTAPLYPSAMSYPQPGFNTGFVQPGYPGMGYDTPTNAPQWIPSSNGSVPPNAVTGGNDINGEPIYVARSHHEGALLPGKLVPSHRVTYVAWGGRENPKNEYEVLCSCTPRWVPSSSGQIPSGAFVCGQTESGESLYVGRVLHEGSLTIGKVQPSHGVCYIPFGGNEIAKESYEILVL